MENEFREIYQSIFTFMIELGVLWQTNSISPSHEHFITSLIKQKIHSLCEKLQENQPLKTDKTFVLYLPDNEIHELGLLYLNHQILDRGYKTIFLGQSVPTTSLSKFQDKSDKMILFHALQSNLITTEWMNILKNLRRKFYHQKNLSYGLLGTKPSTLIIPKMKEFVFLNLLPI